MYREGDVLMENNDSQALANVCKVSAWEVCSFSSAPVERFLDSEIKLNTSIRACAGLLAKGFGLVSMVGATRSDACIFYVQDQDEYDASAKTSAFASRMGR